MVDATLAALIGIVIGIVGGSALTVIYYRRQEPWLQVRALRRAVARQYDINQTLRQQYVDEMRNVATYGVVTHPDMGRR